MERIFILLFLFCSQVITAKTFYVNSVVDRFDSSPDCNCDTRTALDTNTTPICTFRAALQESEFCTGVDTIILESDVILLSQIYWNGMYLTTSSMIITQQVFIDGNNHTINTDSITYANNLMVVTASNVTVRNLHITGIPYCAFFLLGDTLTGVSSGDYFTFEYGSLIGRGIDTGTALIETRNVEYTKVRHSLLKDGGLSVRFTDSQYGLVEYCQSISNQHSNMTMFGSDYSVFQYNYLENSGDFNIFCIYGCRNDTVRWNTIVGADLSGITIGGKGITYPSRITENILVYQNIFMNNGWDGVGVADFTTNVIISENEFSGNKVGISSSYASTSNLSIVRNRILDCLEESIRIDYANGATIDGNTIGHSGRNAIQLQYSHAVSVTNNCIGVDSDNSTPLPNNQNGIFFQVTIGLLIQGNTLANHAFSAIANGDRWNSTWSQNVSAINNRITSNTSGIDVGNVDTISIEKTRIENHGGDAVIINNCRDVMFLEDTIVSNNGNGINAMYCQNTTLNGVIVNQNTGNGFAFENMSVVSIFATTAGANDQQGGRITDSEFIVIEGSGFGVDTARLNSAWNGGNALTLNNVSQGNIGGSGSAGRNYFSSDSLGTSLSVGIDTLAPFLIRNNFIGVNKQGTVLGNGNGINLYGVLDSLIVGGMVPEDRNVIGGCYDIAMLTMGNGARIYGNAVGADSLGVPKVEYANAVGIVILGTKNQVGGTVPEKGNVIAYCEVIGVGIASEEIVNSWGNSVIHNTMLFNNGNAIDHILISDTLIFGHTENDYGDSDWGPNNFLNHPKITTADESGVVMEVDVPTGTYRIDVYKNPTAGIPATGYGEGETFADYMIVTSTGSVFNEFFPMNMNQDDIVTATITECWSGDCENNPGSTSEFSNAVRVMGSSGLPIEMLAFNAYQSGESAVILEWKTSSEKDNSGFTILRSINGTEFDSIGWVHGAGNSAVVQSYRFKDEHTSSGTIYYRLKQVDFDGMTNLSDTRSVEIKNCAFSSKVWTINGKFLGTSGCDFSEFAREHHLEPGIYFQEERKTVWFGK